MFANGCTREEVSFACTNDVCTAHVLMAYDEGYIDTSFDPI